MGLCLICMQETKLIHSNTWNYYASPQFTSALFLSSFIVNTKRTHTESGLEVEPGDLPYTSTDQISGYYFLTEERYGDYDRILETEAFSSF